MSTTLLFIVRSTSGKVVQNANISGAVLVPACQIGLNLIGDFECHSGPDYNFNGFTDGNGRYLLELPYNVSGQSVEFDVTCNGYYNFSETMDLNLYPGHTPELETYINLTPQVSNGSIYWDPSGQGGLPTSQLSGEISAAEQAAIKEINTAGIITAVIIVAIVIGIVALLIIAGPTIAASRGASQ